MSTAIRFQDVSKRFTLHHQRPRSFQELVIQLFKGNGDASERPCTVEAGRKRGPEEFWALRDVSFTIQHGETVGIIGPNGAGKSTVLKLVSRIVEPTSGEIEVNGRIGALLELGAGFHPDLSGRENIYLNSSILGLSRHEIESKLDEIISFAELERFIDMPVKHYSSGMHMRLGFSIAVHVNPDLILIDEGLAVGDEAFQHKCVAKMAEFQRRGCTLLLVSHSLSLVEGLCTRAMWLENGGIRTHGQTERVIASYRGGVDERLKAESPVFSSSVAGVATSADEDKDLRICEVRLTDSTGEGRHTFLSGEQVQVRIVYESHVWLQRPVFSVLLHRSDGLYVSSTNTYNIDPTELGPIKGRGEVVVTIDHLDLHKGNYFLSVGAYYEPDPPYWSTEADFLEKILQFSILSSGRHGVVALPAKWEQGSQL